MKIQKKLILFLILFKKIFLEFIIKIFKKIIFKFFKLSNNFNKFFYFKFFHNINIKIIDQEIYYNRIIKPILGINDR